MLNRHLELSSCDRLATGSGARLIGPAVLRADGTIPLGSGVCKSGFIVKITNGDEISRRIEILRFPLIVGVVFIHSYSTTFSVAQGSIGIAHSSAWVDFIRFFISQEIARVAVPLFFTISGYLFFFGGWSWERYLNKLRRRFNTLLVPFLFWNLTTLGIYVIDHHIPHARVFASNTMWSPDNYFSFISYVGHLLGLARDYPIAFQFWFIRDLMALVLIAPVIHLLLARWTALPYIIALCFLWFSSVWPVSWPSVEATLFFSLGALLSQTRRATTYPDTWGPWTSAVCLALLAVYSWFPELHLEKVVITFGVPSVWWLTRLALKSKKVTSCLLRLSGASFFVFAAHEPFQRLIRKILYKILTPTGGVAVLALYFLIPICLIVLLVKAHRHLIAIMPSFIGYVTGNSYRTNAVRA